MSISETEKIDLAHIDPRTDEVILTITDHLDWLDEPREHLWLLQEKINTYLRFVESNEIYTAMPVTVGRKIRFRVIGKYPLSEEARTFYSVAADKIERAGFNLSFEQRDPGSTA
jgi:hypothetical protein